MLPKHVSRQKSRLEVASRQQKCCLGLALTFWCDHLGLNLPIGLNDGLGLDHLDLTTSFFYTVVLYSSALLQLEAYLWLPSMQVSFTPGSFYDRIILVLSLIVFVLNKLILIIQSELITSD